MPGPLKPVVQQRLLVLLLWKPLLELVDLLLAHEASRAFQGRAAHRLHKISALAGPGGPLRCPAGELVRLAGGALKRGRGVAVGSRIAPIVCPLSYRH